MADTTGSLEWIKAPKPIAAFIDYETSLEISAAIPILFAENTSTYGASDNLSIPVAEIAIDVGRTAGSISAVAEVPTADITSTYTTGVASCVAVVPDATIKSTYTSGFFVDDVQTPNLIVRSTYTLGLCSSDVQLPQLIAESNSTSGLLPIDAFLPEIELSSKNTIGILEISTPKATIKYTLLFGTVGGLSINIPNHEIDISGFVSSFGSLVGASPIPKTRRF